MRQFDFNRYKEIACLGYFVDEAEDMKVELEQRIHDEQDLQQLVVLLGYRSPGVIGDMEFQDAVAAGISEDDAMDMAGKAYRARAKAWKSQNNQVT